MFMASLAGLIALPLMLLSLLLPVALEMGLSAVHFGIIMVVNLAIGFITPPLASTCL